MDDYAQAIHVVGRTVEAAGILAIVAGVVVATTRAVAHLRRGDVYERYRRDLGRALLLGLELLVAGDIISTITTEPSLQSVLVLAVIVAIRTFLSWSIELEIEGRFPWQRRPDAPARAA
jgi:uncharacterized membrane protein